jgi:hypothetical protein
LSKGESEGEERERKRERQMERETGRENKRDIFGKSKVSQSKVDRSVGRRQLDGSEGG